jgi:diphthamide synthase (EF-2-diphthine--ammonia ligase)
VVACVDPGRLDASFAGRSYDTAFLDDLPRGVDPSGENGEFHTFVHLGPVFDRPVPVETGAIAERDGFVFCDLLPG